MVGRLHLDVGEAGRAQPPGEGARVTRVEDVTLVAGADLGAPDDVTADQQTPGRRCAWFMTLPTSRALVRTGWSSVLVTYPATFLRQDASHGSA